MMKRILVLIACMLSFAVVLTACGSDDGEATDDVAMTEEQSEVATTANGDEAAQGDIVAVAQETPDLSTLVDAVVAADLVETLQAPGPYTVFAPTNEAFAALGGTLDTLLEPANVDQLTSILTYHVVEGDVMSGDLSNGQMVETVQGEMLEITIEGGEVMVNDATVVMPDVETSNGVVHVIDAVLTPPGN